MTYQSMATICLHGDESPELEVRTDVVGVVFDLKLNRGETVYIFLPATGALAFYRQLHNAAQACLDIACAQDAEAKVIGSGNGDCGCQSKEGTHARFTG